MSRWVEDYSQNFPCGEFDFHKPQDSKLTQTNATNFCAYASNKKTLNLCDMANQWWSRKITSWYGCKVLVCWIKLHQLKRCKGTLCTTLALKELGCNSHNYNHHTSAWDIVWEVCAEAAAAKHVLQWFYTNLKKGKHTTWHHKISPVLLLCAMWINAAHRPHNRAGICRSTRFGDCSLKSHTSNLKITHLNCFQPVRTWPYQSACL